MSRSPGIKALRQRLGAIFPGLGGPQAFWLVPLLAGLVFQRWQLANFAQWREDQAANLWIGDQVWQGNYLPSIGLISSVGTPNPNGMPWLGVVLSILPSLHAISFSLALLQLALLARLCRLCLGETPALCWAALLASASCLPVVLTGVEFWSQWVVGLVNLLFLSELLKLRQGAPPFWPVFLIVQCILAAPALYIAGVANSAGYALLLVFVLWRQPVAWGKIIGRRWQQILWAAALVLHAALVWAPYFFTVGAAEIHGLQKPFLQGAAEGLRTLVQLPLTIYRILPQSLAGLDQDSPSILPSSVYQGLRLGHGVVVGLLLVSLVMLVWKRRLPSVAWLFFFCLILCGLAPLLGGFAWGLGQRPDQVAQFFPILVVVAFGSLPTWPRLHSSVLAVALLYGGLHLTISAQLQRALTTYRGADMTDADLPLGDRRRAVDFVAADWAAQAGDRAAAKKISVHYAFGAGWSAIIERYGALLAQWYRDEPYTIGRAYDWELKRRWGLENEDEGLAQTERKWHRQRYTVSMVGEAPPAYLPPSARHFEFGRVRVSVLDPR